MEKKELPKPLNSQERMMYGIAMRLDAIINQNDSIIKFLSDKYDVPTTSNKTERVSDAKKSTPKSASTSKKSSQKKPTKKKAENSSGSGANKDAKPKSQSK